MSTFSAQPKISEKKGGTSLVFLGCGEVLSQDKAGILHSSVAPSYEANDK
jgi:hypothetical protein